jgi:hypothetical protein
LISSSDAGFSNADVSPSFSRIPASGRAMTVTDRPRSRISAGLLMFRRKGSALEVLLVHPGGPFFQRKNEGAWTIPKGEAFPGKDLLAL